MALHPEIASWRSQLGPRLRAQWRLKIVGFPAFMTLFFVCYFLTLKYPVFPVTQMPVTLLDRLIDFHPIALLGYASLWFYVSLTPALLDDRSELIAYGMVSGAICVAGLVIFFFWPTSIPRSDIDWARYLGFARLKTIDRPGNACPSLHVAFALFSMVSFDRLLKRMAAPNIARGLNACWGMGIIYSTLATKQHVALDVFGGIALGLAGIALHLAVGKKSLRHAPDGQNNRLA